MYVSKADLVKGGQSLGVAAALSLVCMVTGRAPRQDVAVTGAMDMRGNVLSVSGLEGKLRACKAGGLSALLAPEPAVVAVLAEDSDLLPADLREYAAQALLPYRSMVDAIQHVIRGEAAVRSATPKQQGDLYIQAGCCRGLTAAARCSLSSNP